jgi:hypothetical protein
MAARTTETLVKKILEADDTIITDYEPFITMANELTTECCGAASIGYSSTRLELIERNLAAHFCCMIDPRVASEKAGDVAVTYQHEIDLGFRQTVYGQAALRLDTNGGLAALDIRSDKGKTRRIGVHHVGIEDQTELDRLDLD